MMGATVMPPGAITALLVAYWSGCPDYQREHVVGPLADRLQNAGLIELGTDGMPWTVTERGRVYVDALCAVPLPEQRWVIPTAKEGA
jgi:hypothetical protein